MEKYRGGCFPLGQIEDYIITFTKDLELEPDCFYGVPEGATKMGIITQYKWAKKSSNYGPGSHTLPMGRGKPKEHGMPKDKYFIGQPRGKTIILEDVTTTGGSLLATLNNLTKAKVPVIAAFSLTDRMELLDNGQSVQEAIKTKGTPYYALSNALELLPEICQKFNLRGDITRATEEEFKRYGVKKLKLR